MHKSIQILAPENPAQKLTGVHKQVYKDLPPNFTMKTALEIGEKHGIKKTTFRVIVGRWAKGDDAVLTKEGEQQHAIYQKIY